MHWNLPNSVTYFDTCGRRTWLQYPNSVLYVMKALPTQPSIQHFGYLVLGLFAVDGRRFKLFFLNKIFFIFKDYFSSPFVFVTYNLSFAFFFRLFVFLFNWNAIPYLFVHLFLFCLISDVPLTNIQVITKWYWFSHPIRPSCPQCAFIPRTQVFKSTDVEPSSTWLWMVCASLFCYSCFFFPCFYYYYYYYFKFLLHFSPGFFFLCVILFVCFLFLFIY